MYNKESHRFQKLDDNLQDETMAATMALSLLARRWVKPYIWICGLLEAELHICVYVGKKQINNCLGLIYSLPWPDTQTANQGTREIPVVRFQIESSLLFAYAHKRGRCFFVLPVIFGFEL